MDLRGLTNSAYQSFGKNTLLSDIFADSPLLQGLRRNTLADNPQSPAGFSASPELEPHPHNAERPNSNCIGRHSSLGSARDGRAVKRARVGSTPLVVESIEVGDNHRFRPIIAATGPRTNSDPPSRRPPIPRTKTGCFTCRKRRVKCDQSRPACKRCIKAKRDCEGYDPTLLPGPSIHLPILDKKQRSIPNPRGRGRRREPTPPSRELYQQLSYSVSSKQGSAADPRQGPGTKRQESSMNASLSAQFDAQLNEDIEFTDSLDAIAIDPALTSNPATTQEAPQLFGLGPHYDAPDFSIAHDSATNVFAVQETQSEPLTMASLCKVGGEDPPRAMPAPHLPLESDALAEIEYVYTTTYAPAIDQFLECQWFGQHSLTYLRANDEAMADFANCLQLFNETQPEQYDKMRYLPSAESQLVWSLMRLPRAVPESLASQSPELQVVLNRLLVVERLVTGNKMLEDPIDPGVIKNTSHQQKERRVKFWNLLNHFVSQQRPTTASKSPSEDTDMEHISLPTPDLSGALREMRSVLDEQENRDVLYSIAVVQHLGVKFPQEVGHSFSNGSNGHTNGHAAPEKVDLERLRVAKAFLEDEASGQGMSQVVQRLCAMAIRSWSHIL